MGNKSNYIITAIITSFIFLLGFLLGIQIEKEKVSYLEKTINELSLSVENAELEFLFLDIMEGNISCNYFFSEANNLSQMASKLGDELTEYEKNEKTESQQFYDLKKKYTIVLIKDWLILEKIKKTCGGNYVTVIYFYSNLNCSSCVDQGLILDYFKLKYGENLLIFALDADLDLSLIRALKTSYSISELPTLVINNKKYSGYIDTNTLSQILCKESNLTCS